MDKQITVKFSGGREGKYCVWVQRESHESLKQK